tara:strand:+ start:41 stop:2194 length:2154 start_codon:yes stop_codon:yes gene_type:complete
MSISQTYNYKLNDTELLNINNFLVMKPKNIKKQFNLDETYYRTIKRYLETIQRTKEINDKYSISNCGRMYGIKTTIQKLSNEIRSYIFKDTTYDIDMKNASFGFVKYIINTFFIDKKDDYKLLIDYSNNRTKYFKYGFDKLKFISVLFGANPLSYKKDYYDDEFNNLINQISKFQDLIIDNIHFFNKINFEKATHKGSKLSYIIFSYENDLLQDILKKYKEITLSPIFDGLIINKECNLNNVIQDINKISKKYNIELINKEYKKVEIEESPPEYNNEYEDMKNNFEENHFLIEEPLQYIRQYTDIKNNIQTTSYNNKDFSQLVATFQINDKPFLNEWLKDENRRSYKKIEWCPNLELSNPQYFNSFKGFNYIAGEEINEEKVNIFLEHIYLLTNYENEASNYLIKFIAHLFQKPEELPQTALLFKSYQGVGKDLLIEILTSILGEEIAHRDGKMENIVGTFNKSLENKLIIQLNEVSGKDGHFNKEILKDIITAEKLNIRKMRTDTELTKNYLRLFLFTNNLNPIDISSDDRRYLVFQTGKPKEKDYYKILARLTKDKEGLQSIFNYFMNIDISNWCPHIDRVETQSYKNMKKHNSNPFYEYLYEVMTNEKKYNIMENKDRKFILSKYLEGKYNLWLEDNDLNHIKSNSKVNKAIMLDLGCKDTKFKVNGKDARGFILDIEGLKETLIKYHNIKEEEEVIEIEGDIIDFLEFEEDND